VAQKVAQMVQIVHDYQVIIALPLPAQLVGRPFDEATVLRATHRYQGVTDWHKHHPVL
jgi:Asp-tRNA(Asn)/Glu-tRNA(Gln) amidotransferase A subunit family amidase